MNGKKNIMTTDALGNEITIGEKYSYSQHSNGIITIVRGIAEKLEKGRVTLNEVEERSGAYGNIKEDFKSQTRRRSAYAVTLFPVKTEEDKLYRIPQIIGRVFRPCFLNETDYENAFMTSKYWTEKEFLENYQEHMNAMDDVAECAKIYILKNWQKIKDWSDLHLIVSHGPTSEITEYFKYVPRQKADSKRRGSLVWARLIADMEEDDQKRHNPILNINDVVLDPTDGDFSVTINGNQHWWIDNEPIIILAEYIESQLKKQINE